MEMIYSNYINDFPVAWALHIQEITCTKVIYRIRWENRIHLNDKDYLGELTVDDGINVDEGKKHPYTVYLDGTGIFHPRNTNDAARLIDQKLNPGNWKESTAKQIAEEKRKVILTETMTDLGFLDRYNAEGASGLSMHEWEQVASELTHRVSVLRDALVVAEKEVLGRNV